MYTLKKFSGNLCALALTCCSLTAGADTAPTTWSGTDELQRTLPLYGDAGARPYDPSVKVGMFYYLWHFSEPNMSPTYDVSRILAADSINPAWGPTRHYHWGSRPWLGYYRGGDRDVIARHLQMLCDAGVDFLVFDCTNGLTYPDRIGAVIESIRARQDLGQRSPKLVAMVHSRQNIAIRELWDHFYSNPVFSDLWYEVDGRPLLLCDLEQPAFTRHIKEDILPHFTLRHSWAWAGGKENTWSWLDFYPQEVGYVTDPCGRRIPEAISVSAAQHATTAIGKSYHDGAEPPVDRQGLCAETPRGLFFAEQWERALGLPDSLRVPVLMITQWNEHIAIRFKSGDAHGADPGRTRPGAAPAPEETYFVDVYNAEFNRDLEPSAHPLVRDNYYMQLVDGIRRYRGVQPASAPVSPRTIDIAGPFAQWDTEPLAFADDRGDNRFGSTAQATRPREEADTFYGIPSYPEELPAESNDIILCKGAADRGNLYFMAQTAEPVRQSRATDMQLLLDADADPMTGWHGFDFLAMYDPATASYTLHRYRSAKAGEGQDGSAVTDGTDLWEPVCPIENRTEGDRLMLSLPKKALGMKGYRAVDFKWLDNCPAALTGEPMLMYSDGDCAPNHRFTYRLLPPLRR